MIDLCTFLDPFHPTVWVERWQHDTTPLENKTNGSDNKPSFTDNQDLNHMNPMKIDSSSMFDIGSLLNPMHPTLWLEPSQSLPPQKTEKSPKSHSKFGLGRITQLYHNLILNSCYSKFRSIRAEEVYKVDKEKAKVVVGGGAGFVGSEVCSHLRRKGYDVVIVSRHKFDSKVITWDDVRFQGLPEGTIAVVNLAGQNMLEPLKRWTPAFKELVRESRIQTARSLHDAIVNRHKAGMEVPDVFVQITGVGIYPPGDNNVTYDESSEIEASDGGFMSRLVVDWEDAARLPPEVPTRNVFIRSGVVLGRNGGMIKQIFIPFFMGTGGRMGSGEQNMPWIHVKDVSGIILHSIENKKVQGVLNGVAPQIITNQEFVTAFASSLHRPAFLPLPDFVWNFVFGDERAAIITKGVTVLPRRTVADAEYKFRYPSIDEACNEFSHLFYSDPDSEEVVK